MGDVNKAVVLVNSQFASYFQAEIFAKAQFDGLFFGRADYQDKNNRQANRSMEFIWQSVNSGWFSDNFGHSHWMMQIIAPSSLHHSESQNKEALILDHFLLG